MTGAFRVILAILWKDFLVEFRSKEIVIPILILGLLIIVIFNFAIRPNPSLIPILAPGMLWISFSFAGILGLGRIFEMEKEQGAIEGLMLAPVSKDIIYLGKLLSVFFFMVSVEIFLLPTFCLLFNLPLFEPRLWLVCLLGTFGFCTVGTTFSAMAINTKAKELTLPILFFPIVVPVIIAASEATGAILSDNITFGFARWLLLLLAFDLMFLALCTMTFKFILNE